MRLTGLCVAALCVIEYIWSSYRLAGEQSVARGARGQPVQGPSCGGGGKIGFRVAKRRKKHQLSRPSAVK